MGDHQDVDAVFATLENADEYLRTLLEVSFHCRIDILESYRFGSLIFEVFYMTSALSTQ